ncbi:TonB-dependent receptor [Altericroceibacterium xinjiangense]|uniref:TonB-dependent receptor n=1 Tax=Altericroceibacterium xinjiangense TaxID=762261 RepID=UPI000F7D977E|nr:TonB-dependent siderophore receptor [Altericroceibacterium xinjiangense]
MRKLDKSGASRAAAGSFVALGCVGFLASAPAMAQSTTEPTRLEGVTVTDTAVDEDYRVEELSSPKYTAPVLNTPRIINVITEEVLEDTAAFSLEEAFRAVPGITLGAGEGGTASADIPLIRGVDATGDVFVDGVRDVGSQSREVFALESIEISKGPNSILGGRGSAAGAINLVTKVARQGNFATAQLTAGTSDLLRGTADVNRQLSDSLAVRFVGMIHDSEVPGRDYVYSDRWGVAPSITFGAGGPATASLDYYHLETDALPDYGIPLTSPFQLDPEVRDLRRPADVDYDNFYGLVARDFQETNTDAVTLRLRTELGRGFALSNTTRYSWNTNNYIVTNPDDSAGNVADGLVWRNVKSRNSEFEGVVSNTNLAGDFATGMLRHSVALGFEYSDSENFNRNYSVDTGGRTCTPAQLASFNCTDLLAPNPTDPWTGSITPSAVPAIATAEEYSLYLFDTVTVTPQLLLNGGIRWTDFSATGSGISRGDSYDVANGGDFWSWQGGVIYKPTPDASLYASYADSNTPPGTTVGEGSENIGDNNDLYEPQKTENWEVGGKVELYEGAMLFSMAAFRVDRNNILERLPGTDAASNVFAAARLQGVELSASGRLGPVTMLVGYTYVNSELRDRSVNQGNFLPNTPEHNLAATIDWQATPRFSIGGGAYGASERYADAANLIRADGYVRFDAHAQYELNDRFGLRVNVNNLTDERYIAKLRYPHFAVPAAGRQALATLIARY